MQDSIISSPVTISTRKLSKVAAEPVIGPNATDDQDPWLWAKWDGVPSYASHYRSDDERPNVCQIAHKVPAVVGNQPYNFSAASKDYIPFVGTSVVRDSQLLLLRLYYRWAAGSCDSQSHCMPHAQPVHQSKLL